jgi:hypothetical protein
MTWLQEVIDAISGDHAETLEKLMKSMPVEILRGAEGTPEQKLKAALQTRVQTIGRHPNVTYCFGNINGR